MSCDLCDKVVSDGVFRSGMQYDFSSSRQTVEGVDGRIYRMTDRLIPKPYQPRGGWSVDIFIHNQKTTLSGIHPEHVVKSVAALLTLNEVSYNLPQLWLNLQIQWLSRGISKHQKVSVETVLSIALAKY